MVTYHEAHVLVIESCLLSSAQAGVALHRHCFASHPRHAAFNIITLTFKRFSLQSQCLSTGPTCTSPASMSPTDKIQGVIAAASPSSSA